MKRKKKIKQKVNLFNLVAMLFFSVFFSILIIFFNVVLPSHSSIVSILPQTIVNQIITFSLISFVIGIIILPISTRMFYSRMRKTVINKKISLIIGLFLWVVASSFGITSWIYFKSLVSFNFFEIWLDLLKASVVTFIVSAITISNESGSSLSSASSLSASTSALNAVTSSI